MKHRVRKCCLVFFFLLAGCSTQDRPREEILVYATIDPLAWLAERVGGERVRVRVLLPPGQSPATYDPLPRQVAELAGAKALFRVGVPFERRLAERAGSMFPGLRIVDVSEGIELRSLGDHTHSEDTDAHDDHGEGNFDPHTWLDPGLAALEASVIARTLEGLDPGAGRLYRDNLGRLSADLDSLDRSIAALLAPLEGRRMYVFHPAFGYFAGAYGLDQVAVETGGREPTGSELARLIERMRADSVRAVFVQPQFSATVVRALEDALGVRAVRLDPLARDYTDNLYAMARRIRDALERGDDS